MSHSRTHALALREHYARQLSIIVVRIAFATIVCALVYSVVASADELEWQSPQSIRTAAERFVRESARAASPDGKFFATTAELDPRLRLAACGTELQTFLLNNAPLAIRNVVAVRCQEGGVPGWTVYVPTTLETEKPVLVLRHSLSRDGHVAADDVDIQVRRVPGPGSNYVSDAGALRDQHLKRGVAAGGVLTTDVFARDLLVKRGQEVSLLSSANGIAVSAPGVALADGGAADRIRVQNRSSLKVVEGVIESGNLVRVGM